MVIYTGNMMMLMANVADGTSCKEYERMSRLRIQTHIRVTTIQMSAIEKNCKVVTIVVFMYTNLIKLFL